jgi:hypothetical protein
MPSTTPERRARWPGGDCEAIGYLESRGFKLTHDWLWLGPRKDLTCREQDALIYLIEEWDYGGVITPTWKDRIFYRWMQFRRWLYRFRRSPRRPTGLLDNEMPF